MKKFKGMKEMKKNGGFTLVELIIVIAILAVIAAIAVPNILGAVEKSRYTADLSNAKRIAEAVQILSAEKDGALTIPAAGVELPATGATGNAEKILKKLDGKVPVPTSKTFKTGVAASGSGSSATPASAGAAVFTVKIETGNKVKVFAGSQEAYPNPAAMVE